MRIALSQMAHRPRLNQTREMVLRSVAVEIGVALRWNDRTVQHRMSDALDVTEKFPATVEALAGGRITLRHATVIHDAGSVLENPAERAAFERVVLDRAATETAPRTKAFAIALAERLHPESITVRFRRAEQTRTVTVTEVDDGMAEVRALLPTALAYAIHDRLTQQGRAIRASAATTPAEESAGEGAVADAAGRGTADGITDTRTLDQVRADLFCDLLLTGQPAIDPTKDKTAGGLGAIRAHIQVTVPALTAAGTVDRGASIEGKSPIDAETARRLMAGAPGWDRILTHPVTGMVLAVDRYRPTDPMSRFLGNLACLCKRHHTLKTETEWTAEQQPDGSIRWTSPLGRDYLDQSIPRVVFLPNGDPPPF
jgi:hypothetical protein